MKSYLPAVCLALDLLVAISFASAETVTSPNGKLTVTVQADGSYQVAAKDSGWQWGGNLPSAAQDISSKKVSGEENSGYQQISFSFTDTNRPMMGFILLCDNKDVILFSQMSKNASDTPPSPFPNFTKVPPDLYTFSYHNHEFAPPQFTLENISTPWLFFDANDNAFLISPASHFITACMVGDGKTQVGSGFNAALKNLPAGYTQQTLVAFTHGINHAWDIWGEALTDLQGKKRPANDADPLLKYYGYWTDNGGAYWYNYDLTKGYQATLQALVDSYRAEQIPIRYLQLDSWWYHKTLTRFDGKPEGPKNAKLPEGDWNRYGGTIEYKAHPFIFPNGMETFHESTGLPFITHNRWIDPASPYHAKYKISGIAAIDPGFWNEIATYLHDNGVICYEQDWQSEILNNSPELSSTVDQGDAFFDGMANACKAHGLSVQYCMGTPRCFLQGSKYDNVTTIRVNGDRFEPAKYHSFLYTSRLAFSLGIWPWTDVFKSTEISNLLLSTLSAGPVGTGDAIGQESKENILKAVRADGVIVKPDVPIVPTDAAYISDAQKQNIPVLATTYTDHNGLKTIYVAVAKASKKGGTTVSFKLSDVGAAGSSYLYDYFAGTGQKLDASATVPVDLQTSDCAYYVLAPIGGTGIAFLGDTDNFVGTGKKRIAAISDDGSKLTADVILAADEPEVKLQGYAPGAPEVAVSGGQAEPIQYDASSGIFTVIVKPDATIAPKTVDGDPARKITVTLQPGKA
jgi:hypothetical protein